MKAKAVIVIASGWTIAVLIAFLLRSSCPNQCRGEDCNSITLMGCTPGITSARGLVVGGFVALAATAVGLWIMRREGASGRWH
ncbi:MAG: hypothetical protein WDA27_14575 [Actinomycetota bacterium]